MVDIGTSGVSKEVYLNGDALKILPCRHTKKSRFLECYVNERGRRMLESL
jgi:hypothetical protein